MRGRIGSVKKSNILKWTLITFLLLFFIFIFLNIFIIPYPTLWFYVFCTLLGFYELLKSRFFKLDSSFYLGALVFLIGISGFVFIFTNTIQYVHLYLLGDFFLASILTFIFFGQKFNIVISYLIFFVTIFTLLYTFSLISLPIFIAILVSFLILLILIIIFNFIWRKG